MARKQERLVAAIRARRQELGASLRELVSFGEVERRIRNVPIPWLVGSVVAGLVGVRVVAPLLARRGRSAASAWIRSRLRQGVLALALAAAARDGRRGARRSGTAGTGEGEKVGAGNGSGRRST
ncbi:MAG: hypothetical protein ACE5G2_07975 [Candidatus Krumholzibacteriia bacterium]